MTPESGDPFEMKHKEWLRLRLATLINFPLHAPPDVADELCERPAFSLGSPCAESEREGQETETATRLATLPGEW